MRYSIVSQALGTQIANAKRGGVTLSERIWKNVDSSRKELEIIIQNNIIEGKGAEVASREVRQYLNDPKKLFRRVKDKETGEYKLSKAAQMYHPGQGKYRSSFMNARRLMVSEMNMATQASECAAYANNPLIAGYEIRLSNNHTVKDPRHKDQVLPLHDICDELQGTYPPTFKFTGWHPHCRCSMIPILISPEERRKLAQARAEGKPYQPKGVITDVPDNYKAWIVNNQDRIQRAKSMPYFLQDNGELTKDGYVIDEKFTDTPIPHALQVAEKRHAERTTEQEEAIRKRAEEREQQLQEYDLLKKQSGNILNVAKDYGEVDYTDFENTLDSVKSNAIYHNDEMAALKAKMQATISQIQQQKAAEKALSDIIPDVHQWHKQFTIEELQKTKDSVTTTIDNWLKKYGYTSLDEKPSHAKAKLELEITNVVSSKKYSTWQVAESSYKKMLKPVADKVVFEQLSNDLASYASFKTKSTAYKSLLQQMSDAIANKDKIAAQIASDELKKKQQSLTASQSKSVADKNIKEVLSHTPKVQNTDKQKGHLPTGMTKAERVEKIKELTGVNDAVANDMNDAVNGFSYQWDYEIRQVQCGNNVISKHGHSLQQICKKANDIEDFIAKSPQWDGGVTYRGISLSPKELDALRDDLKAGVGNMQGSASWSSKEQTSKGFSGFHIGERSDEYGDTKSVRVLLKTPSHYSATSIKHLSNFPGEDEIISSKLCRYKYVREYMDGPYLVIEVLPNN